MYFSKIWLLGVDLIHQSYILHVFLPKAALIYINIPKVIDFL